MSDTNPTDQNRSAPDREGSGAGEAVAEISVYEKSVDDKSADQISVDENSGSDDGSSGDGGDGGVRVSAASAEDHEVVAEGLVAVAEQLRPGALEALLFASGEPVPLQTLCRLIGATKGQTEEALKKLAGNLAEIGRGVELVEVVGKFQLRTKQSFGPQIRVLRAEKPKRLSPAALETLAIVAYRQPVVKSDIERIRGVDTTPTIKTLIERGLIQIVGHQQTVGSPALYGTTEEFLKVFGLKDLAALPTLREVGMIEAEPGDEGEEDGQSVEKNGEGEGANGETESRGAGSEASGSEGDISGGASVQGVEPGGQRESSREASQAEVGASQ